MTPSILGQNGYTTLVYSSCSFDLKAQGDEFEFKIFLNRAPQALNRICHNCSTIIIYIDRIYKVMGFCARSVRKEHRRQGNPIIFFLRARSCPTGIIGKRSKAVKFGMLLS